MLSRCTRRVRRNDTTLAALLLALSSFVLPLVGGCEYVAGVGDRKSELGDDDSGIPGDDAGTDAQGADAPGVDAPGADGGGTCLYDIPERAALSQNAGALSLVRLPTDQGGLWVSAWAEGGGGSIRLNAVDAAGTLVHTPDVVTVTAQPDEWLDSPRLVTLGSRLFLAYARYQGPGVGQATTVVTEVDPATGLTFGPQGLGTGTLAEQAPGVSGAIFNSAGDRLLVSSRAPASNLAAPRTDLFSVDLTRLTGADTVPEAYGEAAAWSPGAGVFGVAMVVDGTPNGGVIKAFTPDLAWEKTYPFTNSSSGYPLLGAFYEPAIAGAANRFYLAWLAGDGGAYPEQRLQLTYVDASTGTLASSTPVTVAIKPYSDDIYLMHPMVLFDGTWVVVAWLDGNMQGSPATVRMRRFDQALNPVGGELCPSCVSDTSSALPFDLVSDGPGRYGVAYLTGVDYRHRLIVVDCTSQ